jgi:hypothetical protein
MLTNLSGLREMTLEERMELPIDDELIRAVERTIHGMIGSDGTLDEGLDEVAHGCFAAPGQRYGRLWRFDVSPIPKSTRDTASSPNIVLTTTEKHVAAVRTANGRSQ